MPDPGKITVARFARAVGLLWPVVIGMFLAAVICWGIAASQTDQYRATSILLFHEGSISDALVGFSTRLYVDPEREAATNDLLVSLPAVAAHAAARLGTAMSPQAVSEAVDVQLDPESNLVKISATDPDATRAAAISNAYATAYVALRRDADQRKLRQAIRQLQAEYTQLTAKPRTAVQVQELRRGLGRLEGLVATQSGNAQVIQRASIPQSPASPQPAMEASLGAIIGAMLGLAAAIGLERRGFVVRTADDLARVGRIPVIELSEGDANAFRSLRMCAPWKSWSDEMRTIVVTAPPASATEAGRVAARLALGASRSGFNTVLADCDLGRPTLDSLLSLDESPGVVDVLRDRMRMSEVLQTMPSATEGVELRVLAAGSAGPEDRYLLEATGAGALETHLAPLGTQILILCAPPISRPDLLPLLVGADGTVLAYRLQSGRAPEVEGAVAGLQNVGVPLLAAVATAGAAENFDDLSQRKTAGAV